MRDGDCDAVAIIGASEPGHCGCGAGQSNQADTKETMDVHDVWQKIKFDMTRIASLIDLLSG